MKSNVFVVLSAAAVLNAAEIHPAQPGGFTVHEWGTFTSIAGEDGAAIYWDVLAGKDDLPGFVDSRGYRCLKSRISGTVRMETPVLYFYSPRALDVRVTVAFPKGLVTESYPPARYQGDQRSRTGGAEWNNVKVEPHTTPDLPAESAPSRYYAARATDAAPVTVGAQHEKFLFYRGVGSFAVPLSARLSADGKVVVANLSTDPVPLVMLFENRGGRLGYRSADAVSGTLSLSPPSLDGSLPQLCGHLEDTLVAQGLFRKEARAMVETWRDSWFEEGSRLIYIVPSPAVDAILPLQVDPAPSQTARVFVGRIELITPETRQAVEAAVAAHDPSVVDRYGRFLDPILNRLSVADPAGASRFQQFRATVVGSVIAPACR